MIGHFEAEGLVSVSRASQWLAAVTRAFRGRTETDPSWVIFCSRVVVWELPLVLPGHRGLRPRVGLGLEGGQHAGGGRQSGLQARRELPGGQAALLLLQVQDVFDRERRGRERGARSTGVSALASVLPKKSQG